MDREDRSLASIYRIHGRDAVYTAPDLTTTNCRIVFYHPSMEQRPGGVPLGSFGVAAKPWAILVRSAELADPVVSGFFVVGGKTFVIGESPIHQDPEGREWRCATDDQGA